MKGYIHSFESLAALDGEGLRYGIFMMGCNLRCAYCHNPDTQNGKGIEFTSKELVKKILRYKPYFKNSGGVTFSGGEPLLQAAFINETADELLNYNINYALDTAGAVPLNDYVKKALDRSYMALLDVKFAADEEYIKYTGVSIKNVLQTLDYLEEINKKTWIRTVIVPGINDSEEAIDKYCQLIYGRKNVAKYELLPFHTMGFTKYEKLGIRNVFADKKAMDKQKCNELQIYLDNILKTGL